MKTSGARKTAPRPTSAGAEAAPSVACRSGPIGPGQDQREDNPGDGEAGCDDIGRAAWTRLQRLKNLPDGLAVVVGGEAAFRFRLRARRCALPTVIEKKVAVGGRRRRAVRASARFRPCGLRRRCNGRTRPGRRRRHAMYAFVLPYVKCFLDSGQRRFCRVVRLLRIIRHIRRRLALILDTRTAAPYGFNDWAAPRAREIGPPDGSRAEQYPQELQTACRLSYRLGGAKETGTFKDSLIIVNGLVTMAKSSHRPGRRGAAGSVLCRSRGPAAAGARPSDPQRRYLERGLSEPGGKLPLFDRDGREVPRKTIEACIAMVGRSRGSRIRSSPTGWFAG